VFQLGVEKVVINTALDKNKELLAQIVSIFGSQAVVASIDYKKSFLGGTKAYFTSGSKKSAYYPIELAQIAEKAVGGELILNSLDRESTYQGYELEILKQVVNAAQIPVMISVGVSSKQDLDAAKQISAS
jgi:cyclase